MKKQTKLVAVLSTASLLAIGASMTSFAATGWAEEDGTWVYYNRDGERATESWKKSGNNWYYLDENGEMAIDQLIEDGDNYYYVDANGVMASNQWVAIENEDAGEDDEPEHYWYYFQANGKALRQGNGDKVSLKTVNGKKYAFEEDGKMLFGWVSEDSAERIDNTDGEAFREGDYYFGSSDDGAMTTGWLLLDITYDEATNDDYKNIAAAFNDDEDQSRWFYFQTNGKKLKAKDGEEQKSKTINGRKYEFDKYGAMTAEWSIDHKKASNSGLLGSESTATHNSVPADYTRQWRYFSSVDDGARISKGWFKVVPAEYMNFDKYNGDEDSWYYADGSGKLYAGDFWTIKGKKYAFRNDGRMVSGLKFISGRDTGSLGVFADDDDPRFDTEDDFLKNAAEYFVPNGIDCYYFGSGEDGSMKTGKTSVTIDGDNFNFYFEKSGSKKGAGVNGEKDDKYYLAGMLLKAGSDEKYQAIYKEGDVWTKFEDIDDIKDTRDARDDGNKYHSILGNFGDKDTVKIGDINTKKKEDLEEAYVIDYASGEQKYLLVNTAGTVANKGKHKDGDDFVYVTNKDGEVLGWYVEN